MIALARQIGLSQSPSSLLYQLHFTECSPPCWIGILPGQTVFTEAVDHIKTTFAFPDQAFPINPNVFQLYTELPLPDFNIPQYKVPVAIERGFGLSETAIASIGWMFQTSSDSGSIPSATLGDAVSIFGVPTCVYIGSPSQGWILIWDVPEGVTQVNVLGGDKLSWSHSIYVLVIRQHTVGYGRDACHTDAADFYTWSGLLSREQYQQRYPR